MIRCVTFKLKEMRFLSILLFFLVGFFGYTQVTITGVISDEKGLPIRDAHVHIANKTTSTDNNGSYRLSGIPKGKQKLYISFIGYSAIEETIEISNDLTLNRLLIEEELLLRQDGKQIREHDRSPRPSCDHQR